MTKGEMLEMMRNNPMMKFTHPLLRKGEYIYMDYTLIVRDVKGCVLEAFVNSDMDQPGWEIMKESPLEKSRGMIMDVANNDSVTTLEDFINLYMAKYSDEVGSDQVINIIHILTEKYLMPRISDILHHNKVATDRITYVTRYLEGKLYTTKQAAEEHRDIQLFNAEQALKELGGIK